MLTKKPARTAGFDTIRIATISMHEFRNTYDDLKKRVEQLGRFL